MILASGAFDGIHVGHVRYLRAARVLSQPREEFVVALAPDAYIRTVKHREPHWPVLERLEAVGAVDWIDALCVHGPDGVADTILRLKPRVFVKGLDWKDRLADDVLLACHRTGTVIEFVDSRTARHTADLTASMETRWPTRYPHH